MPGGRQFGSPCFKWLIDLSLLSDTEVYKYIFKKKQSFVFSRNLIIPSNLSYFMHLVYWYCHILLAMMTIFIASCFIFVRRSQISVTESSPILPSLIVVSLHCSSNPICVLEAKASFKTHPEFLFMVTHCPEGTCRFALNTLVENIIQKF